MMLLIFFHLAPKVKKVFSVSGQKECRKPLGPKDLTSRHLAAGDIFKNWAVCFLNFYPLEKNSGIYRVIFILCNCLMPTV
jgi:hypothetical protein